MPHRMIFFDVETDLVPIGKTRTGKEQIEQVFREGMAAYVRRKTKTTEFFEPRWFEFKRGEVNMFWEWVSNLCPEKTKTYMFAHNVGFDFPVTKGFEHLERLGWFITSFIIDDPPTMLNFEWCPVKCGTSSGRSWRAESACNRPHKSLVILDTLNYFRMSLKALGAAVGTYKLEMPALADGSPDWSADPDVWREYNKQDVQVLIDAMQEYMRFINRHDLGSFRVTQASQSFTAFRHRFMKHQILIDDNEKALTTARGAYYGGRVEAFQRGEIIGPKSYKLDINSMYPFVMHDFTYPTKLVSHWKNVSISEYNERIRPQFKSCAYVKINVPMDDPAFPKHMDGKLVFPCGKFYTYLSTPEINYAIDKGYLDEIIHIAFYEHEPIFKEFIDYFYTLRLEAKEKGNEKDQFFLKIMMNSLYGKFGQNGKKWENESTSSDDGSDRFNVWADIDAESGDVTHYRQIGRLVQRLAGLAESQDSHPAIASHITADARMYLWKLINMAGKENVYYCDTDSVFTNENGRDRLHSVLDNTRLGALKVEAETTRLIVNGLKDYSFGNTIALKGVRDPHNPVAPNVYKLEIFRGLKGALREHDLNRMIVTRGVKRLTRIYNKGVVNPDGSVTPFELDEKEMEPIYYESENIANAP